MFGGPPSIHVVQICSALYSTYAGSISLADFELSQIRSGYFTPRLKIHFLSLGRRTNLSRHNVFGWDCCAISILQRLFKVLKIDLYLISRNSSSCRFYVLAHTPCQLFLVSPHKIRSPIRSWDVVDEHRHGSTLSIKIHLSQYPQVIEVKWKSPVCNSFQMLNNR